jgi:hypothetical protein
VNVMDEEPMTSYRADCLAETARSVRETQEIEQRWVQYLNTQYGERLTPEQLVIVLGEAYQRDHGGGRWEVEREFSELADFARSLLSAG